jgi:hypothetical protein
MKQDDAEQALLEGLLQGVKNHVAKIADVIIGDVGTADEQVRRFANGLKASRAFYAAAMTEIKKEYGEDGK